LLDDLDILEMENVDLFYHIMEEELKYNLDDLIVNSSCIYESKKVMLHINNNKGDISRYMM
jgi:hypothetical protein